MFTLNYNYKNEKLLKKWLQLHEIASQEECLVQFFCGVPKEKKMKKVASVLSENLPKAHIIGTTTDGEISADKVSEKEIVISVSVFEKTTITSIGINYKDSSYSMGQEMASALDTFDAKVMISFTTGLAINGEEFLNGLKSISKCKYVVAGGMAGDNGNFIQTYVSHNGTVFSKGAVGVVLKSSELNVENNFQFGWEPVGLPMKVTKSVSNRVYELDGIAIINVYEKYFGLEVSKLLPRVGVEIPLILNRNGHSFARACINKFDDGSLLFAGNVKEGEEVRFGIGSVDKILRDSILIDTKYEAESIFMYSCMARRRLLKKESSFELRKYTENCTVSGFFTYGEFFSDEADNYLLNETMTVLALNEFSHTKKKTKVSKDNIMERNTQDSKMMYALTHMTNVIAREWQDRVDAEIQKNKEQEKQNFQKNKLAQMGEMIGMIAHQWRQPLNAISATGINLSLLSSMNLLEPNKIQESSEFIQEQCQKMSSTIDTFMNFVKPAKESKAFKLTHTLDAIIQIMGTQLANHNITVNIDATNKNISMIGYEDLLEQVIINLLSNSRDAFDNVEVAALKDTTSHNKFINITIDMQNNIPIISIEDNAGGVPHAIQDKIFNPYFTTKEQGKGTGIGLYMSMDIMKKSFDGDLKYKATECGSCFKIICGGV